MGKEIDEQENDTVLVCESRCDSEDTTCPEHCEIVEKNGKIVP